MRKNYEVMMREIINDMSVEMVNLESDDADIRGNADAMLRMHVEEMRNTLAEMETELL